MIPHPFFNVKYAGVERLEGSKIEDNWNTAVVSEGVPVKNCVLVFVVPENQWEKSRLFGASKCWLTGVTDAFLSACGVCVIAIRFSYS